MGRFAAIVGVILLASTPLAYLFHKDSALREEAAKAEQIAKSESEAKKAREAQQLRVDAEKERHRQRENERALDERLRLENLERQQAVSRKQQGEYEKVMRVTSAAIAELEALKRVSRDLDRLSPHWRTVLSNLQSASAMSKYGARSWMGRGHILAQEVFLVDVTGCAVTVKQRVMEGAQTIDAMAGIVMANSFYVDQNPYGLPNLAANASNLVYATVNWCKQAVDTEVARLGKLAEEMKPVRQARP